MWATLNKIFKERKYEEISSKFCILGSLGKILKRFLTNFEKVSEYRKMLIDLKNFKEIHWKFWINIEKF